MDNNAKYTKTEYVVIIASVLYTIIAIALFANDMSLTGFVARDRISQDDVLNVNTTINDTGATETENATETKDTIQIPEEPKEPIMQFPSQVPIVADIELEIQDGCVDPSEDMSITSDTNLCSGTYALSDSSANGAIRINANNVVITCEGTILKGNNVSDSTAFLINNYRNITIVNCTMHSYTHCYEASSTSSNNITIRQSNCKSTYNGGLTDQWAVIYMLNGDLNITGNTVTGASIGITGSFAKATGIQLPITAGSPDKVEIAYNHISTVSTGIALNSNHAGSQINTLKTAIVHDNIINNTCTYNILGGTTTGLVAYNNRLTYCGVDCLSPRGNNTLIYNNHFENAGHKMGIDLIDDDTVDTTIQGYNHTFHDNNFTSSATNKNSKTWVSPCYTAGVNWYSNNDGDFSIALRGFANIHSYNNRFINIEDNDTTKDAGRGYGLSRGDLTANILLEDDVFINVSGAPWVVSAKNVTIKNNYICKSDDALYPYDLVAAGNYQNSSHITTITLINNTRCSSNLTYYFEQNNRTNITVYQNSSYKIIVSGGTGRGVYYTLYAQDEFNDIYNGSNGALIQANFTTVSGYLGAGQQLYITAIESDNISGGEPEHEIIAPNISIVSPLNDSTHYVLQVLLNASASDDSGIDKIWYKWNSTTNYSYNGAVMMNFTTYSSKFITVYANDTYGNIGSSSVILYTAQDSSVNISEVEANTISNSSANITWNTNIVSNSSINYGLTEELGTYSGIDNNVTEHSIVIDNLLSNTTYYYNVTSANVTSGPNTFILSIEINNSSNESANITSNESYESPVISAINLSSDLNCSAIINKLSNITVAHYLDDSINSTSTGEYNGTFGIATQRYNGTWHCIIIADDGMNTTNATSSDVIINETNNATANETLANEDEETGRSSGGGGGGNIISVDEVTINDLATNIPEIETPKQTGADDTLENAETGMETESAESTTVSKSQLQESIIEPILEQPAIVTKVATKAWHNNKSFYIAAFMTLIFAIFAVKKYSAPIIHDPRIEKYTIDALHTGYTYDAVRHVLKKHYPQDVIDHHFHILRRHNMKPVVRFSRPIEKDLLDKAHYLTQVKGYIAHQRDSGFKDEHIRRVLLTNGYPQSLVKEAFDITT